MKHVLSAISSLFLLLIPGLAAASGGAVGEHIDLTTSTIGYAALGVFAFAYIFVMTEELTHLRKSKPVILAAGILWVMVAWVYSSLGDTETAGAAVRHNILEYAELLLFLLVAMTYVNALEEREVFNALKSWLIRKGFSFRQLFWITGILSFFISPIADNLTTALLMCAVIMAVGGTNIKFISIACVNIVVAANAGGAFSPFGDITTLMVWQKGIVDFWGFFVLFVPAAVNYLVPAAIMHFYIPNETPVGSDEVIEMKQGAIVIIILFLLTIVTAVSFHSFFHLPPMVGMMTGLSYLMFFGYYLKRTHHRAVANGSEGAIDGDYFDIFKKIHRAEWDTLLFFYGVVLCVGALGLMGYLTLVSGYIYNDLGATTANILVGVLSAIVDNIPVMFAVLTMNPEMSQGQWLLVTLTAGVGGSLLSIGSAAGVALMGQAQGKYTFGSHLKWTPVIALGYGASIYVHMWLNAALFT
ncbi:MAG: sodium:proton antiporter NhaD [Gammaproteobacteria bacterium]|nr:sodium:proton antiporter NhaD [Gammaproteobacteria bacterium]